MAELTEEQRLEGRRVIQALGDEIFPSLASFLARDPVWAIGMVMRLGIGAALAAPEWAAGVLALASNDGTNLATPAVVAELVRAIPVSQVHEPLAAGEMWEG